MAIKVLIHGSDVTRNAFKYDKDEMFQVIDYDMHFPMASFCSPANKKAFESVNLSIKFKNGFSENKVADVFSKYIEKDQFDLFLLDFVDERLGLINIFGLGYTSNWIKPHDFNEAVQSDSMEIIDLYGNYHKRLFFAGFDNLYKKLKFLGKENTLVINKVFLPTKNQEDENITQNYSDIVKTNIFLESIYLHIIKHYPEVKFIEYDRKNIILDSSCDLESSSFNFVNDFYLETLKRLENIYVIRDVSFSNINISYKNSKLSFTVEVKAPFEVEFAAYLYNGLEKVDEILYQELSAFEFNVSDKGMYKVRFFCRKKGDKFIKTIFSKVLPIN